jgi:transposase
MIPLPTGVRVWIAAGHTDMRRGMQSLALQVQEGLKRDPDAGEPPVRFEPLKRPVSSRATSSSP